MSEWDPNQAHNLYIPEIMDEDLWSNDPAHPPQLNAATSRHNCGCECSQDIGEGSDDDGDSNFDALMQDLFPGHSESECSDSESNDYDEGDEGVGEHQLWIRDVGPVAIENVFEALAEHGWHADRARRLMFNDNALGDFTTTPQRDSNSPTSLLVWLSSGERSLDSSMRLSHYSSLGNSSAYLAHVGAVTQSSLFHRNPLPLIEEGSQLRYQVRQPAYAQELSLSGGSSGQENRREELQTEWCSA